MDNLDSIILDLSDKNINFIPIEIKYLTKLQKLN
jgi:Leucine-rich repeat (LRR) protein